MSETDLSGKDDAAPLKRGRLGYWFSGAGIRTLVTAVFLPLVVSIGGTLFTNRVQNRDSQIIKERSAFIDEARTFDVVVANYVQKILDNKQPDDATQQLIGNVVKQSSLLNEAARQLPSRDRHLVNEYKSLLGEFRDVVPISDNVTHMRAFWESASKVLVARNALILKLQD